MAVLTGSTIMYEHDLDCMGQHWRHLSCDDWLLDSMVHGSSGFATMLHFCWACKGRKICVLFDDCGCAGTHLLRRLCARVYVFGVMAAWSAFVETCSYLIFTFCSDTYVWNLDGLLVWTMNIFMGCHFFWPSRVGCTWLLVLFFLLVLAVLWGGFITEMGRCWMCS